LETYSLASLRYDLSKLRAKQLVQKVPRSRRYRLTREGYCICLVFLKLFERIYAPLTAGLLQPLSGDSRLQQQKRTQLDQLYQRVVDDLNQSGSEDRCLSHEHNENKISVTLRITVRWGADAEPKRPLPGVQVSQQTTGLNRRTTGRSIVI
jgi:hypothetical protein